MGSVGNVTEQAEGQGCYFDMQSISVLGTAPVSCGGDVVSAER